jgi:dTDP-4-dehydrorhamnose 3,5-epimerase
MSNNEQNVQYYTPTPDLQVSENFYKTSIQGLWYFQAAKHHDERGFFSEIVKLPELEQVIGHPFNMQQVNHARSVENVVRGMHAEGWNKLVTVVSGLVFSAVADVRPQSATYKQVEYFKLGYDYEQAFGNGLFISQGLANSVVVLQGPVSYLYFVDKLYAERNAGDDQAISVFDPDLNITWPINKNEMKLSERDRNALKLREVKTK